MSRRHTSERDTGYSRDDGSDRRERDPRPVQGGRDAGSRTPVRTTPEVRPTTLAESRTVAAIDQRSAVQSRTGTESRETRDSRVVADPRSARDPLDTTYGRDPRTAVEPSDRRATDTGRDLSRETRAAQPGVPRDSRDARSRPEEIAPRQGPRNEYFLPGEDISREVITADICRYLGPDALVRPYRHQDGRHGYLITAYRALTTAMIKSLKQDSLRFESDNRRRVNAGHRPQTYSSSGYDPLSRMETYDDRSAVPMNRGDSRYTNELEPRRPRVQAYGDDDMDLDMDSPMDSRDARYSREAYDSRDPRARPQATAGYTQPGRDPYPYDDRPNPRLDPRADPRPDPRADPRLDPRADPRITDPRAYAQPAAMAIDRDYPMGDNWPAYSDSRGPVYSDPRATTYGDSRAPSYGDSRAPSYGDSRAPSYVDTRGPAYGDLRGPAQQNYPPATRHDQYGALPPNQAGAISRGARDELQMYIDPQTGRPMMANNPGFDGTPNFNWDETPNARRGR